MTRRVVIACTGYGQTGARYQVTNEDGRVLVANSRNPEYDAARTLLATGIVGRLEIWRKSDTYPSSTLDIKRAAGLTVYESDRGLIVQKYQPYDVSGLVGGGGLIAIPAVARQRANAVRRHPT